MTEHERPPLPPYSGKRQCPKTGHPMSTVYLSTGKLAREFAPYDHGMQGEIHLRYQFNVIGRKCPVCGYCWLEAPLDAQQEEAP